jgi:hypothetical protein
MAESGEISIALTPVQLFAILNGKSISQAELASNSWHEMPGPPRGNDFLRFTQPFPSEDTTAEIRRYLAENTASGSSSVATTAYPTTAYSSRQDAWTHQSHYSQPNAPDCWIPPAPQSLNSSTVNRAVAVLEIVGGGAETVGGVLLLLTPEPTLLTKALGGVMTVHGADFTQAAIRQLFSGKRVEDFTEQGATWAARQAGASPQNARRIGVVLDVSVGLSQTIAGFARFVTVRAILNGRIILSEEAVAGKWGRVSLDVEEADKTIGKEGGHTLKKHVDPTPTDIEGRAARSHLPDAVISRFASKQIAEDSINYLIKVRRAEIRLWAANPGVKVTQEFELGFNSPLGEGFAKATGKWETLSKLRVVFQIAQKGPKTIFILTALPIR